MSPIPPKTLAYLALVVALLGGVYALRIDPAQFVSDDGGIYLRYAERIARGRGFNYNDGENINGASSTLLTLALALCLRLGLTPAGAITAIAVPAFAATAGLVFWTFARHWSLFAAGFVLAAFASVEFLFDYLFDALEPTLVMLLAAALFHALHTKSEVYRGVVLGLLVATKLDGALAAVAFTLVSLATRRAFPLRVALVALVAALPVLGFLLVRFGSILPQSAATKIFDPGLSRAPFDPAWMSQALVTMLPYFCLPAVLSFVLPAGGRNASAVRTVQVWLCLHVAAYSTIDLGAPFPWYCTLPAFLIVILATVSAASLHDATAPVTNGPARPAWSRALPRVLGLAVLVGFFALHGWPAIRARLGSGDGGDRLTSSSASEIGRAAAGAWLRKHTSGTEIVGSSYGLPAFEYKGPVHDVAQLNTRAGPDLLERLRYSVDGPFAPGIAPPADGPHDFDLVATFQYGADADLYAVYAAPESEIARAGRCHAGLSLLSAPPLDAATGAPVPPERFLIRRDSLFARVPCDVVFTVRAPCTPRFALTPEIRSGPGRTDRVVVRVRVNGAEVLAETLAAGAPGTRRAFDAPALDPASAYRLELSAEAEGDGADDVWVMWGELAAWAGEPLAPADFTLTCPAWTRRIEAAEGVAAGH